MRLRPWEPPPHHRRNSFMVPSQIRKPHIDCMRIVWSGSKLHCLVCMITCSENFCTMQNTESPATATSLYATQCEVQRRWQSTHMRIVKRTHGSGLLSAVLASVRGWCAAQVQQASKPAATRYIIWPVCKARHGRRWGLDWVQGLSTAYTPSELAVTRKSCLSEATS